MSPQAVAMPMVAVPLLMPVLEQRKRFRAWVKTARNNELVALLKALPVAHARVLVERYGIGKPAVPITTAAKRLKTTVVRVRALELEAITLAYTWRRRWLSTDEAVPMHALAECDAALMDFQWRALGMLPHAPSGDRGAWVRRLRFLADTIAETLPQ